MVGGKEPGLHYKMLGVCWVLPSGKVPAFYSHDAAVGATGRRSGEKYTFAGS